MIRLLWLLPRNLIVNVLRALRLPLVLLFRGRRVDYVEVRLKGEMPPRRSRRTPPWWLRRFFPPPPTLTVEELDEILRHVEEDRRVRGVVLRLEHLRLGWGEAIVLRERLARIREHGKEVVAYLEDARQPEYYLATAAERIFLAPAGHLWLTGLAAEIRFYKDTLAKISTEAEVIAAGRYKSAFDPFTRDRMSPAHREAVEAILDDLAGELERAIANGRKLPAEGVRSLIDAGPYPAGRAVEAGLADGTGYGDEMSRVLGDESLRIVPAGSYLRQRAHLFDWRPLRPRALGWISLEGMIHGGRSRRLPGRGPTAGHETICAALEAARKDRRVRALVLHIDSPGGSVLASDLIWHAVQRLREKKPVVALMGNLAASGGYYVACGCDHIVASPGTLTGSIGVISGKLNAAGLLARLGIHTEVLKRGESADLLSASRAFTPPERERMEQDIQRTYDDFVSKVAQARELPPAEVAEAAEGRVWTGRRAVGLKLVDELGGLPIALQRARERAGLPAHRSVPVWQLGRGPAMPLLPLGRPWMPGGVADLLGHLAQIDLFRDEPILALAPFTLHIR